MELVQGATGELQPGPTGHRFRMDCAMAEVIEAARSGEPVAPGSWSG